MSRPQSLGTIDLMLEIPTGKAGMGMKQARALTRDKGTDEFFHHPAHYLFKDAGDRMSLASDPDRSGRHDGHSWGSDGASCS